MMLLSILLPLAGALAIWCVPAGNRRALNAYAVLVLAASAACCAAVALGADRTVTVWRLTDNLSIARLYFGGLENHCRWLLQP